MLSVLSNVKSTDSSSKTNELTDPSFSSLLIKLCECEGDESRSNCCSVESVKSTYGMLDLKKIESPAAIFGDGEVDVS